MQKYGDAFSKSSSIQSYNFTDCLHHCIFGNCIISISVVVIELLAILSLLAGSEVFGWRIKVTGADPGDLGPELQCLLKVKEDLS